MTSVAELFVIALARASRRARRHLRGLERADRDDVLATAILWCWEHKATYQPSVSLDDWFISAIRDARKAFKRGEAKQVAEMVETIAAPDDPAWQVEIRDAVKAMCDSMDDKDRQILKLRMEGLDTSAIATQINTPLRTVERRLTRLRAYIPERENFKLVIRKSQRVDSDAQTAPSWIDKEIERLDFAPPAGRDCPPCWKCRYFDGFIPQGNRSTHMQIMEPEIRAAVSNTEARKIAIAYGQRK